MSAIVGTPDVGAVISDLWDAELCAWRIEYHPGFSPWVVILEWTQEGSSEHSADWTTHTWQFYGDTVGEALSGAVEWLWALAPWRRCDACGGEGRYWGPPNRRSVHQERQRVECGECNGTGFANLGRFDEATA